MSVFNFVLALLGVYLLWAAAIRWASKKVTCTREFTRKRVFEGESGELVEIVRNDTPVVIPWLRVESNISPYLLIGRQENLHVSAQMYYCSVFTLFPYRQIRRTHQVRFLHRGAYDLGSAAMTCGDVLGMLECMNAQKLSTPVLVYPRLLDADALPIPISRTLGELVRRRQLLSDPFLIRGIRDYHPGDPVRDIHWPATARTGTAQLRVKDDSARSRLLVVLNVQYQDMQLNHYIPDTQQPWIEDGIRLAASVCIHALRSGLSAGLASNMPMEDPPEPTILLPADGSAQEEELLGAFARLRIQCVQRFPVLLESLESYQGLDILILSRYDSESIRAAADRLCAAGNQVSFHLLEGGAQ